jgi:hypothetical protein
MEKTRKVVGAHKKRAASIEEKQTGPKHGKGKQQ